MSNQEQYEEICNKAKKYDELVKAIDVIEKEIANDSIYIFEEANSSYVLMVPMIKALHSIDRHTRRLTE